MEPKPSDTFSTGRRINLKIRLGRAIQSRRYELAISQEELGGRAGLHRTYISDIERGARNPSLESIEKLSLALNIPLPQLFERAINPGAGEDSPSPTEGGNHIGKENSAPERRAG